MRGRLLFIIAFVLILEVVGIVAVYWFVLRPATQAPSVEATPTPPPIEILIVSQNLSKGEELDETVMAAIPWQQSALAPGMFTADQITELKGRVIKYDLNSGTPLMDSMLLDPGETLPTSGSPWALSIPSGMVAVAIPISRLSSVAYAPRAGDRVNVIVTLMFVDVDTEFQSILPDKTGSVIAAGPPNPETEKNDPLTAEVTGGINGRVIIDPVLGQAVYVYPGEAQRPRYVSQMLLQDVQVLQVGNFPLPGQEQAQQPDSGTPTPEGQQPQQQQAPAVTIPDVITLVVRPQDAVALNWVLLAQSQLAAQLSLVLRGASDESRENILPVTLGFLLDQHQIPVPAKLPFSLNPRVDALSPQLLPTPAPPPQQ